MCKNIYTKYHLFIFELLIYTLDITTVDNNFMKIINKNNRKWLFSVFFLFSSINFTACSLLSQSAKDDKATIDDGRSASELLSDARRALDKGNYETAIKDYETLEARYPLGRFAQQSMLETAYAYYKAEEEDTALDTIDRFMRIYPRSPIFDYALYLRGLVNFNRGTSITDKFFPRSFADLDNVKQKESFHDFSKLTNRYPNSKYVSDAKMRIQHLRNSLSKSEVNVAQYYMKRGAYLAAFNRAEYAIKHYQGSPAVIDALVIKMQASEKLGKKDLAAATRQVIELNFPKRAANL
jgi:outer membrane protein assembly factor BamD